MANAQDHNKIEKERKEVPQYPALQNSQNIVVDVR